MIMDDSMRLNYDERGLTLLELMVVIAIIAILAALAFPSFISYFQQRRLAGAAEVLYHDLHDARSEAIRHQANVTVVFQDGVNWCYGITTASSCNCSLPANCDIGQVDATDSPDISMVLSGLNSGGGSGLTIYSGSRGATSATGYVEFTVDSKSIRVMINALGFPSVCSVGNVGEYATCS